MRQVRFRYHLYGVYHLYGLYIYIHTHTPL